MAKVRVEVCMVSARGLPRSSSLWKLQWFAVGWIDPNSKYCSKIDSSGSSNPTWNTKFSTSVDVDGSDVVNALQDLVLTVEVYRREPVFLGKKLHGAATVALKEFVGKHGANGSGTDREVGSFQLRKKKSGKPRGFVDVSVRVSRQGAVDGVAGQYPGSGFEELEHWDRRSGISLAIDDGPVVAYPSHARRPSGAGDYRNYNTTSNHPYRQEPQGYPSRLPEAPPGYPHNQRLPMSYPHTYQTPPADPAARNASPPLLGAGPHRQGSTPPPPPPPSNTGFIPSLFPGMGRLPESYVNVPSTGRTARGVAPAGFGAGLGAGALAAGAVIFGDDFLAAADFPAGFGGGGLALSADPPF